MAKLSSARCCFFWRKEKCLRRNKEGGVRQRDVGLEGGVHALLQTAQGRSRGVQYGEDDLARGPAEEEKKVGRAKEQYGFFIYSKLFKQV
jgi:hypothetical protein